MSTVHCLHEGRALCGRSGTPSEWYGDEWWLSLADWPLTDEDRQLVKDLCATLCVHCNIEARRRKEGGLTVDPSHPKFRKAIPDDLRAKRCERCGGFAPCNCVDEDNSNGKATEEE